MGMFDFKEEFGMGGKGQGEKDLSNIGKAPWESGYVQRYLPEPLQYQHTNPMIQAGLANIFELLKNPGGLNPNISAAINPRLANESQSIATNFLGMGQNQAGSAARNNLPVSIKSALESALNMNQERAQREARNNAMTESEGLRRQDSSQLFALLDALNQFMGRGVGQGMQGIGDAASIERNRQASNLAFLSSVIPTGWVSGGMGSQGAAGSATGGK